MQQKKRYWEIDLVRGIAIILMIIYHFLFDVYFLNIIELPIRSLPYLLLLYPIGALFLLLVGISLTIRFSQISTQETSKQQVFVFLKQGLFIFSLGLLISIVTFIYPHDGFVVFGVLHCIGISIVFGYFFLIRPFLSLCLGCIFIVAGILISNIQVSTFLFVWFGLRPQNFYTLDYFPLLPWFGIVLIGIFLGSILYPKGKRRFDIKENITNPVLTFITFLGKHSLQIYLIHQPVILGLLFLVFLR